MKKKDSKKEIVDMVLEKEIKGKDARELKKLIKEEQTIDVDEKCEKNITFGDKLADKLTEIVGSWRFIIGFTLFLLIWIFINLFILDVDPYPFILLNLFLSCVAAIQAPIIMMSENRAAKKEVLRSKNDYQTDLKSELLLEQLYAKMDDIMKNQKKVLKELNDRSKD